MWQVRRSIREANHLIHIEELLLEEVTSHSGAGSHADETLTEAEFLIRILKKHNCVDEETLTAVRRQFKTLLRRCCMQPLLSASFRAICHPPRPRPRLQSCLQSCLLPRLLPCLLPRPPLEHVASPRYRRGSTLGPCLRSKKLAEYKHCTSKAKVLDAGLVYWELRRQGRLGIHAPTYSEWLEKTWRPRCEAASLAAKRK